jgi:hypothetical protein
LRIDPPAVHRKADRGARRIFALYPPSTPAGTGFNVQGDGESAILVAGWGFERGDRIFWNGRQLATTRADLSQVSAIVPPELIARPGTVTIVVRDPAKALSTPLQARFEVLGR